MVRMDDQQKPQNFEQKRHFSLQTLTFVLAYTREWTEPIIQILPPMLVIGGSKTDLDGKGWEGTSSGENGF